MHVAILTISDSVARGERVDLSGPALALRCRDLGWEVTASLQCSEIRAACAVNCESLRIRGAWICS